MRRATFSTLIPLILLAGCGSSDGGISPPGDNNPPPPAGFAITSANGLQVSQVAYQAVVTSGDIAGLAGSAGVASSPGDGLAKPGVQRQFAGTLAGILQKVLVGPTVVDCLSGGTVTVTMDVEDLNVLLGGMLSVGDTILNILVSSYDMTMTMIVTNFQVNTGADVVTGFGDATATLNTLAAPYVEASVSGTSMTTDTNSSSSTLSNYASAQTLDATVSPAPYTMDSSGTLDSSDLTGAIDFSTPTLFQGFDTDYPNAGVLLVGSASGSATLTAEMNGVDVTIRIYSSTDGTGDVVDTIMTTWAELAGM